MTSLCADKTAQFEASMIMAEEVKSLKSSPLKRPWQGHEDQEVNQSDNYDYLSNPTINETNKRIKDDRGNELLTIQYWAFLILEK